MMHDVSLSLLVSLSFLVSLAIGFLFVSLLWPAGRSLKTQLLLRICLGAGIGHGITSCLFFLWLLIYGRAERNYCVFEFIVLAVLLAAFVFKSRKRGEASSASTESWVEPPLKQRWLFAVAFCAALVSTAVAAVTAMLREPFGNGWDAWAIYGVRARAIFRGGVHWKDAFSTLIPWSHTDYPLMLPLSSARTWLYCGREVSFAQAALTTLLTLATAGLLFSALTALRSRTQGYIAGVVLLGFTNFVAYGASAYADVPVMFFCAATLVLFALQHESESDNYNHLILAGVAAGLAAWTKNEGSLFVVASLASYAFVALRADGWRRCVRQLMFVALGLAPVLAFVLYFKVWLAPPSELMAAMGSSSTLAKLLDHHRYFYIAREFWRQIIIYTGRGINLAYLLLIYLVCIGATLKHKRSVVQLSLTLCLMLAGYFWVYLTSPYDLAFHVSTSIERLLLQMWPSFIFLYFLTTLTPEESFRRWETN
jgi:hypothetical protein